MMVLHKRPKTFNDLSDLSLTVMAVDCSSESDLRKEVKHFDC